MLFLMIIKRDARGAVVHAGQLTHPPRGDQHGRRVRGGGDPDARPPRVRQEGVHGGRVAGWLGRFPRRLLSERRRCQMQLPEDGAGGPPLQAHPPRDAAHGRVQDAGLLRRMRRRLEIKAERLLAMEELGRRVFDLASEDAHEFQQIKAFLEDWLEQEHGTARLPSSSIGVQPSSALAAASSSGATP
jgi:hypothetical protein